MNDHRRRRSSDQETADELSVEQTKPDDERIDLNVETLDPAQTSDESKVEDSAVTRWRAELEARRRAGIPDDEVLQLEEVRRRRRPRRFRSRWLVLVALVALVALLVDLAYVGLGLRSRLSSASSSLGRGRGAIDRADYGAANRNFRTALSDAREAAGLERHPGWQALRVVPGTSDDAATVSVLGAVAGLASRAGLDAIDLFDRLGATRSGLAGALFEDGRVRLRSVARAARSISPLLEKVREAAELVNQGLEPRLGALDDALNDVRRNVSEAVGTLHRAETLLAASPSLFGQGAAREYLLVIQNPSTSRASGGVIEYHAIFSATDGKLQLGPVLPVSTLESTESAASWTKVNRSVSFPKVARKILELYEAQTGKRLDGVIGADSIALQYMSTVTGPLRGEGFDLAIGEDSVARVLMHDVFEYFEGRPEARDRFVADVVEKIWFSVTEGLGDSSVLLAQLARATREQHLRVYVSEPSSTEALDQLKLSGDPTLFGPRVQLIAQNSRITSNVDFFLRRETDTRITLNRDGSASIDATLTIENQASDEPPSPVLGRGSSVGKASLSVEMLLPEESDRVVIGNETATGVKTVDGHPLISVPQTVPPGALREITVSYELPAPAQGSSSRFSFHLLPAPLAYPDRASVHVIAPEGFCIDSCAEPSPGRWDLTTRLTDPLSLQVRLINAAGEG